MSPEDEEAIASAFGSPELRRKQAGMLKQGRKAVLVNGRLVDMTTHASALNALVEVGGAPPSDLVADVEAGFGVKWNPKTNSFEETP